VSAVATRLANCESDVEISANQAMEERVITTAAAPVGSVGPISGPASSAPITRTRSSDPVRHFCPLRNQHFLCSPSPETR